MVDGLAPADAGEDLFMVGSVEQFEFGLRLLIAGVRVEVIERGS